MSIWIGMECANPLDSYHSHPSDKMHMTLSFLELNYLPNDQRLALESVLQGIALASSGNWVAQIYNVAETWNKSFVVIRLRIPPVYTLFQQHLLNWLKEQGYQPSQKYAWRPHVTVRYDGDVNKVQAELDRRAAWAPLFSSISLIVDGEWTTFPFG